MDIREIESLIREQYDSPAEFANMNGLNRQDVYAVVLTPDALTIKTLAAIARALGYRLAVSIEPK